MSHRGSGEGTLNDLFCSAAFVFTEPHSAFT